MTNGNQCRVARTSLRTQDLDGRCTTRAGVKLRVLRKRHLFAQGSPGGQTLLERGPIFEE